MFEISQTETFTAPVKVNVATPSGAWREESFDGIFKRTDENDRERLAALKNTDLLREVLVGWKMVDKNRQPVEYNEVNFEGFLLHIGACRAAAHTYWQYNTGAKEKN